MYVSGLLLCREGGFDSPHLRTHSLSHAHTHTHIHTHTLTLTHIHTQSLSRVTDAVVRVNEKADREFFIKIKGTGTIRPVDRV